MKVTVRLPDLLVEQAMRLAAREDTTLSVLVEEGLHRVLAARHAGRPFQLRKASLKGNGLQRGMAGASWERIRDAIYTDHEA
jgi:hypothetical protein